MNHRGFALVTVLWLITALSAFVGGSMAAARLDIRAAQNRIAMERGAWAAEACVAILEGRRSADAATVATDTVNLGRGLWCRAQLVTPASRLNINTADRETLRRFFEVEPTSERVNADGRRGGSVQQAVWDWRDPDSIPLPDGAEARWYRERERRVPRNGPFASVRELEYVRGVDAALLGELASLLTVRGDGRVDLLTADERIVRSLSMLTPLQANRILAWRTGGRAGPDHTRIASMLERQKIPLSADAYRALVQQTVLMPTVLVIQVEAGVAGLPVRVEQTVTVIPVGERLAVLQREVG